MNRTAFLQYLVTSVYCVAATAITFTVLHIWTNSDFSLIGYGEQIIRWIGGIE